jgi:hypothetical protein
MKRTSILIFLSIVIISGIFISLTGCSSKTSKTTVVPTTASAEVGAAADTITENILTSLDNNDYTGFSKNLDQTAKSTLTQTSFDQLYSLIKSSVGNYQSKELVSATAQGNTTTVVYIAKYSSEPANVTATLGLQPLNGTLYISAFSLDSPKIQGQTVDVDQTLAYTGPETENLLLSLNKNDYNGFIKDADQAMQAKTLFDQTYQFIKTGVGDYVSKEFGVLAIQGEYIVVRYHAVYTNEPAGVWVTVSFDKDKKVAGLFFDSPKLRTALSK